jgi:hypothetical protein
MRRRDLQEVAQKVIEAMKSTPQALKRERLFNDLAARVKRLRQNLFLKARRANTRAKARTILAAYAALKGRSSTVLPAPVSFSATSKLVPFP